MTTPDRATPVRANTPNVERRTTTTRDARNPRLQPRAGDNRVGEDPRTMRDDRNAASRQPVQRAGDGATRPGTTSNNRRPERSDATTRPQASRPERTTPTRQPPAAVAAGQTKAASARPVAPPRTTAPATPRPERTAPTPRNQAPTPARAAPTPRVRPEASQPTPAPQRPAAKPARVAPPAAAAPASKKASPPTVESREASKPKPQRTDSTRKDKREL